ncbi:MAG: hypothetical protein NT159_17735 [Proteobacteria bacterium]|nr:hypothetical protein [Pseudomonadota bacterium]
MPSPIATLDRSAHSRNDRQNPSDWISMPELAVKAEVWKRAFRFSLVNAAVFVVLSVMLLLWEPDSLPVILSVPALFFLGAMTSFVMLIRGGGAFAPIAWFILGAGTYFGLGTLVGGLAPDERSIYAMSQATLFDMLTRINLLNSSSVMLVLVTSMSFPLFFVFQPVGIMPPISFHAEF